MLPQLLRLVCWLSHIIMLDEMVVHGLTITSAMSLLLSLK